MRDIKHLLHVAWRKWHIFWECCNEIPALGLSEPGKPIARVDSEKDVELAYLLKANIVIMPQPTKGKLIAPDGWTFEYNFTCPWPRTIRIFDEAGDVQAETTFYYSASLDVLASHLEAFEQKHEGDGQLRFEAWAEPRKENE